MTKKAKQIKQDPLLSSHSKKRMLGFMISFFLVIFFGWFVFDYVQMKKITKQNSQDISNNQDAQKEIEDIIQKVSKHILLLDEQPVVATIYDVEKLQNEQSFYQHASNGDKLLIYSDRAIIYNPQKDIIINAGPVLRPQDSLTQNTLTQNAINEDEQASVNTEFPYSIEIRNGSKVVGIAQEFSLTLDKEKYQIDSVVQAAHREYTGNIIVNVNEKNIEELAQVLNARIVDSLPDKEKETKADVLIIMGNKN